MHSLFFEVPVPTNVFYHPVKFYIGDPVVREEIEGPEILSDRRTDGRTDISTQFIVITGYGPIIKGL